MTTFGAFATKPAGGFGTGGFGTGAFGNFGTNNTFGNNSQMNQYKDAKLDAN